MIRHKLLIAELSEMYWFENAWVTLLGQLGRSTCLPELGSALKKERAYTQEHVSRLRQIFGWIDEPVAGRESEALKGLIEDLRQACSCLSDGDISCDISFALSVIKAANYQIGAYSSILILAELIQNEQIAGTIRDTISEEKQAIAELQLLLSNQNI
jgi:ferritin-like metal-binding protein YciE